MASPDNKRSTTPSTGGTLSPLPQGPQPTYNTFTALHEHEEQYRYKAPWTPSQASQAATVASLEQSCTTSDPRATLVPRGPTPASATHARSQTPGFPMTPAPPSPAARPQTPEGFPTGPAAYTEPASALTPEQIEYMRLLDPRNPEAWELKNIKCCGFNHVDEDAFVWHMYFDHGIGFLPDGTVDRSLERWRRHLDGNV